MTVKAILEVKGRDVVTITPDATIGDAAKLMGDRRIGAVVVTGGDRRIAGILSERDIVRVVGAKGAIALDEPVASAMTTKVRSCTELQSVNELMEIMTIGRFRHVPVERDGKLDGIISIGDVVKRRIEDVEREAEQMKEYIASA